MPELPEAETMARDLAKRVRHATITGIAVNNPEIIPEGSLPPEEALGLEIASVSREGKKVLFRLTGERDRWILVSLGMTGSFALGDAPSPHERLRLTLRAKGGGAAICQYRDIRKFGRVSFLDSRGLKAERRRLNHARDPFGMGDGEFARRIAGGGAPIKALLLDQRVVSGFGNIYAAEALFAAGISPFRKGSALTPGEGRDLFRHGLGIFREAIRRRGSTIRDYQAPLGPGSYQESHKVYGREGKPCPRCGTPIRKDALAGRATFWCPGCQK
jgi:formamidopyrimidine-DNA glycosylase